MIESHFDVTCTGTLTCSLDVTDKRTKQDDWMKIRCRERDIVWDAMSGGRPHRIYRVVGTPTRCYPPLTWRTSCLLQVDVVGCRIIKGCLVCTFLLLGCFTGFLSFSMLRHLHLAPTAFSFCLTHQGTFSLSDTGPVVSALRRICPASFFA